MSFKSKRKPKNRHKNPKSKQSIVPMSGTISTFKNKPILGKRNTKTVGCKRPKLTFIFSNNSNNTKCGVSSFLSSYKGHVHFKSLSPSLSHTHTHTKTQKKKEKQTKTLESNRNCRDQRTHQLLIYLIYNNSIPRTHNSYTLSL